MIVLEVFESFAGVEDLDFFIGDEAMDAKGYAVKVKEIHDENTQKSNQFRSIQLLL